MAFAILAPKPNSHPFHERQLSLKEPVKVGRAIAKAPSSNTNGIFDCKVLSRNHAVMWYENGKFMLQDTKSSNGTYVNSVRLSRGSEVSEPCEIKSGDTLQFGVEVVENSKNVTHECIIGLVTLFNEDGTEASSDQEDSPQGLLSLLTSADYNVQPHELWQLAQLLQEALHREQMMENKLATLQRMLGNAHVASEDTFQGFIQEDKLLSRLETLENQLEFVTKEMSEEEVQAAIVTYQQERLQYESAAKERLQVILKEKIDILQKCGDLERLLSNSEDEYSYMKSMCEKSQDSIEELLEKNKDLVEKNKQGSEEICRLKEELAERDRKCDLVEAEYMKKTNELNILLEGAERWGSAAAVEVESLQAECDFTKKQLQSMKERFEQLQEKCMIESGSDNGETDKAGNDLPFASENATLEKDVKNKSAYIQTLKEQLASVMSELQKLKDSQRIGSNKRDRTENVEQQDLLAKPHLPDDFYQIENLHEKIVKAKGLVSCIGESIPKDEQINIESGAWEESIEFDGIQDKSAADQSTFCRKALSTSVALMNAINGDLQNLSMVISLKYPETSNISEDKGDELKDQVDLLHSQLAEEKITVKKNKALVVSLEGQLDELNELMTKEVIDRSMTSVCLDAAIKLAKELNNEDYPETIHEEKVEVYHLLEENSSLKKKLSSLQADYDDYKQEAELKFSNENKSEDKLELIQSLSTVISESEANQSMEIANLSVDELQIQLELANQSIDDLKYEKQQVKEVEVQKQNQLVNLIITLFFLMVGFGALVLLDIIHIAPGSLPYLDGRTWAEIWDLLF